MRGDDQKIKGLQSLSRLIPEKRARSSSIEESAVVWLEKFHLLNDQNASVRLESLRFLKNKLRENLDQLLPFAQRETDYFHKSLYFPFGPLVLLALDDPKPYTIMWAGLQEWRWSDRGTSWDVPGQPDSLYRQWKAINIGKWTKEQRASWLVLLSMGAANLDSRRGRPFNPEFQFIYLSKLFFRSKSSYSSYFHQSDERTQQFVRQRVADYMSGRFSKGRLLYDRKQFGSSQLWHHYYQALIHDVKLADIPEALGHLVYLCLKVKNQDQCSKLFAILAKEFPWFPQGSIDVLKQVRDGETMDVFQQISPPFNLAENNEEHRQYLGVAYNLAIKAMVEFQHLLPEKAYNWLTALTTTDEALPHLWLARVEALATCGSCALEELEKMLNCSAQPPHVRRYMMQYLALMQEEAGLPLLCKTLTEQKRVAGYQELVEGCLYGLSRLRTITNGNRVIKAISNWWTNNYNKPADEGGRQLGLSLALQALTIVQTEGSSALNRHEITAMIEVGLNSPDQQTQIAALHACLVLQNETVTWDSNTISNFKKIILAAANSEGDTEQLEKILGVLATQRYAATNLFDQSFSLEMLCYAPARYQPSVLKLIRKTYQDLKSFFTRSRYDGENILAHMLSPQKDAGTRLAALAILWKNPELWELEGVYDNVLKQANFNTNKEPVTAAKALELLAAHRLHDNRVQGAILDFCSRFKNASVPSMAATRLIENNFFDFELTNDLGNSLQRAITDCYTSSTGRSSSLAERTTFNVGDENTVFALCRLYSLLLRARIIYPLWPNFSILFTEALTRLDSAPWFWVKNDRRTIKAMLSSYRLALEANPDKYFRNDNFTGALHALSRATCNRILRPQLMAAFLGLNLFREPPFELYRAFQQYNREISLLLTAGIQTTADTNALNEFIQKARTKVKEIHETLPKPGESERGSSSSRHPFPESALSQLLQDYLRQPSRVTYHYILQQIDSLFPQGDEGDWSDSFWHHSGAYLDAWHTSQYHWWLCTARDRLHNADNQASRSLENATPLQLQAHARRFLGLPALVNSLMLNRPEPIPIAQFLRECKNKLETAFQRPGVITIAAPDVGLKVYFDRRRLESVFENCFTNALHSVDAYNIGLKGYNKIAQRSPIVTISVTRQDAGTEIKVIDNGGGLPPGFSINHENMGLGTAIIREYVENSTGGAVHWADNNPSDNNEGAHVTLTFPDREILDE